MRNLIFISLMFFIIAITGLFADDDGLNNYKNKKFEEAKSYYEQILTVRENDAAASLGLGASQYQLGDIPNAAKSFEEALNSKDINIQNRAYYNLGNSLYSQQKMEESIAFYRKALELNPNDDDAKFNYELAKYITQQQQEQNQDDQQDEQNQQQNDSKNDNDQENKPQDTDKEEPDKQEDEESDSSQQEERDAPKTQKQMNAEAILDALKDEEKIHQKVKMAQQSSRKFEKDW